jgi:hypothetical protein
MQTDFAKRAGVSPIHMSASDCMRNDLAAVVLLSDGARSSRINATTLAGENRFFGSRDSPVLVGLG